MEKYKDPWAKGERLAALVKGQRTLLILDGLEPLQHPPGPLHGELSDPSLQSLLRGLCDDNPGLCLVTTREAVPDLEHMQPPRRVTIDLNTLDEADGAELLALYGVHGSDEDLRQASADVGGHSLALVLLATYLAMNCGGDVSRRTEALLFEGHERYAAHAHKVMASYEAWFAKQDDIGRAAVVILRLMGLFNRPADPGCLAALRAEPPIPGLTEPLLHGNRDELWTRAVERLRQARLLADDDSSNRKSEIANRQSLDAHPLVREHFAKELERQHEEGSSSFILPPSSFREAHRRLYQHLKQSAPELPDNLNDMMPLYHAVAHGCKAGLWQEAWDDVYMQRIQRGNGAFAYSILGAFGADLSVVRSFFTTPWSTLVSQLTEVGMASVLGAAGFSLRAVGRLSEVAEVMSAGLKVRLSLKAWKSGAVSASNLSELSLTLGDVSSAVRQGEQSVELADRSGDAFQ